MQAFSFFQHHFCAGQGPSSVAFCPTPHTHMKCSAVTRISIFIFWFMCGWGLTGLGAGLAVTLGSSSPPLPCIAGYSPRRARWFGGLNCYKIQRHPIVRQLFMVSYISTGPVVSIPSPCRSYIVMHKYTNSCLGAKLRGVLGATHWMSPLRWRAIPNSIRHNGTESSETK